MQTVRQSSISVRGWIIAAALLGLLAAILLAMGRPPICPCGTVSFWHGTVESEQNSQQFADWYSFSHVIHGFLFLGLARWLGRRWPRVLTLSAGLALAILIEGAWEVLENSPIIINRYREVTMAFGYSGDSVFNSVADTIWMIGGFMLANRLRAAWTIALAIGFELLTLWTIRDNLTLNVLMLVSPVEAIKEWQSAGPPR